MVQAVVFDIGGVLERVGPPTFLDAWASRLGLDRADVDAAYARVDPHGDVPVGRMSEAGLRAGLTRELGLTEQQADAFMADQWDWYCGDLDVELVAYAESLRATYRTAILSNSGDGARREEEGRYGLHRLVETIVYSHEIGVAKPDPAAYDEVCRRLDMAPEECALVDDLDENVVSARAFGMHAVLHEDTERTIAELDALLGREKWHPGVDTPAS